mmetsp:Transcript_7434/g.10559  ORF Transcript_7434/g.10559 Transcript_7434/m.10559 type:complete len:213 (-) Transcript_7434:536-1174(-)
MREELGHVAQLVGLQAVDGGVLAAEDLVEGSLVLAVHHAEALPHQAVVAQVGALVGTALHEHVAHLGLVSVRNAHLDEFVAALLEGHAAHNGEVDGPAQVHQVLLRQVHHFLSGNHHRLTVLRHPAFLAARLTACVLPFVVCLGARVAAASQNLAANLLPQGLVLREVRVHAEDVQHLLLLDLIVQPDLKGNLLISFDEIQFFWDGGIVFES